MSLLGTLVRARRDFQRVLPLFRDDRVPLLLKVGAVAGAILIVSPVDIFGDIPALGLLDDAVLLGILATIFVRIATSAVEKNVTPPPGKPGTSLALD